MRALLALLLLAAVAGGGLALAGGGDEGVSGRLLQEMRSLAASDPATSAGPAPSGAPFGAPATRHAPAAAPRPTQEEPPEPGTRVYYQYVDASGAIRFVERLEDVPADQRARAGRIEVEARPEPEPRRTARATAERPFARVASQPRVVVYTTSWCGWCRKTLAWLDAKGVDYVNKDIERDPAHRSELVRKTGSTSIPVVEIDGTLVQGYNPGRMGALLDS